MEITRPERELRSSGRLRDRSLTAAEREYSATVSIEKISTTHSSIFAFFGIACLIVVCPPLVIYLWYAHMYLDGSLIELLNFIRNDHGLLHIREIWPKPSLYTLEIISCFILFQALLFIYLPGSMCLGPFTPTGNRPIYKNNGFAAYCATMLTYYIFWRERLFNPASLYNHLGEILSAYTGASMVLSVLLYVKGLRWPSSSDCGSWGNFVFDFFWGLELHPRVGRFFDVKIFINSRLGMMSWALLIISYMCKQYQNHGHLSNSMLVSGSLMLLYISKHFWLEHGYYSSLDIAQDRGGLYNLWSSLVWIPSVYSSPALFLVSHPAQLGYKVAAGYLLLGFISIGLLFDCDNQKIIARDTKGKCKIWGQPIKKINGHYLNANGEWHSNLLLTSGWWGKARHFHYFPEIAVAFCWTLPCLLTHFLPYFYLVGLIFFLVDRAKRDDLRCRIKYRKHWELYCKKVPWKIIPKVY